MAGKPHLSATEGKDGDEHFAARSDTPVDLRPPKVTIGDISAASYARPPRSLTPCRNSRSLALVDSRTVVAYVDLSHDATWRVSWRARWRSVMGGREGMDAHSVMRRSGSSRPIWAAPRCRSAVML